MPASLNATDENISEKLTPTSRTSNLKVILGIGGGAIAGLAIGVAVATLGGLDTKEAFLTSMLTSLFLGACVGTFASLVGSLAGLGAVIAMVLVVTMRTEDTNLFALLFLTCPLLGCGLGLSWSALKWAWRHGRQEAASPIKQPATVAARQDRMRLAYIALGISLVLGGASGGLLGQPYAVTGLLLGAVVGGALFLGLMLSAFVGRGRKGEKRG